MTEPLHVMMMMDKFIQTEHQMQQFYCVALGDVELCAWFKCEW